ncbi:hypothetical protein [Nitratidesulfovibrio liaohensis]|uniref:hypothetical protein n=1 Tax=Nitratidesulfovibrio liaohensis TaxID=2604158 RepID=UPI00141D9B22|nr:hypothetical protein [Nitratidesulfovibrio liaohensis]NHZ46121.1 hypothetical protein [Nitratidesulfovibrio liaohensis]
MLASNALRETGKFIAFACYLNSLLAVKIMHPGLFMDYFAGVCIFSAISIVLFIISSGGIQEILGNIVISIILIIGARFIPILFVPLLFLWIIGNVARSIITLKDLFGTTVLSTIMATLLFADEIFGRIGPWIYFTGSLYALLATGYACRMRLLNFKHGILNTSLLILAMPIFALTVASLFSGLKNAFSITRYSTHTLTPKIQNVSAHMRGDTLVSAYQRTVQVPVESVSSSLSAGTGAIGLGASSSAAAIVSPNKDEQS